MRAVVIDGPGRPPRLEERAAPEPGAGQVALAVEACGVCRTDLHLLDGELPQARYPVVPGHQIVGRVTALGAGVEGPAVGSRVGVPWLGWTCGKCAMCRSGRENLCPDARFTGCTIDGGFAERCTADVRYAFPLSDAPPAASLAPLLCAGLIGFRALRMAGDDARRLGFYGFGAAAHLLAQIATFQDRRVYAFVRPGDDAAAAFAREQGAVWAGPSDGEAPEPLDAAILFAPVGALVPRALRAVRPGGRVVCAGIHMSDVPSFPYSLLWEERSLQSVANLTRADGDELLPLAERAGVRTTITEYPLERAGDALEDLRHGRFVGSAVLVV